MMQGQLTDEFEDSELGEVLEAVCAVEQVM